MGRRIVWLPALLAAIILSGCASISHEKQAKGEAPIVTGPPARDNFTPLMSAYACYKSQIAGTKTIGIGVGDVKDYTGKYSDQEGNAITQGGALMVMSALGKLSPHIRQHERFDTRVGELELVYIDRKQLGNGGQYKVDGKTVPWEPYYGGSIRGSDYYIVGGITELNYNIQSGGAQVEVNQIGPKGRTYVMNIAADLRIVDTRTLIVQHTVSLQKQIVGYEVGFGVFRFFGTNLVDVNTGAKNQEPLQLGVRTVLELGVLELVSAVTKVPHQPCLDPEKYAPQVAATPILTPKDAPWSKAAAPAGVVTGSTAPARPAASVAAAVKPEKVAAAPVAVPVPKPERIAAAPLPSPKPQANGPASLSLSALVSSESSTGARGGAVDQPASLLPETANPAAAAPEGEDLLAQRSSRLVFE